MEARVTILDCQRRLTITGWWFQTSEKYKHRLTNQLSQTAENVATSQISAPICTATLASDPSTLRRSSMWSNGCSSENAIWSRQAEISCGYAPIEPTKKHGTWHWFNRRSSYYVRQGLSPGFFHLIDVPICVHVSLSVTCYQNPYVGNCKWMRHISSIYATNFDALNYIPFCNQMKWITLVYIAYIQHHVVM